MQTLRINELNDGIKYKKILRSLLTKGTPGYWSLEENLRIGFLYYTNPFDSRV